MDRVKKVRCSCRDCIVEMLEFAVEVKMTEQMYWFTKNELLPMKQANQQISDSHVHNMVERGTRWRRMFDSLWAPKPQVNTKIVTKKETNKIPKQNNQTWLQYLLTWHQHPY